MKIKSFKVIGISVRTTNEGGKSSHDLGKLWKDFIKKMLRLKYLENK